MAGSLKICSFVIITIAFLSAFPSNTLAHVIGGGLNTDISVAHLQIDDNPEWLKAALSTVRASRNKLIVNEIPALNRNAEDLNAAENEETTTMDLQSVNTEKEVKPAISRSEAGHPFLRAKRQTTTCQFPERIPANINDISSSLNGSQFLGLNPQQPVYSSVPANQPAEQCPSANGSWWSQRTEFNLKSTCPWVYKEKDLGENFFPRYLSEAKCLCEDCITADAYGCEELKQSVTVFQRQGCKNGVALLNQVEVRIVVGCFCAVIPRQDPIPSYTLSY